MQPSTFPRLKCVPTYYSLIRAIVGGKNLGYQKERDQMIFHQGLKQVVGGFLPTCCLFAHPSGCLRIM